MMLEGVLVSASVGCLQHSTEASAAVGVRVLLEPNKERQTEVKVEGSRHKSRLKHKVERRRHRKM